MQNKNIKVILLVVGEREDNFFAEEVALLKHHFNI